MLTRLFTEPVRYRQRGTWHSIADRWDPATSGERNLGFRWRAKSSSYGVLIKPRPGKGFLWFDTAGQNYDLTLIDAANVPGAIAGPTASFAGVRPGADLSYTFEPSGVKEAIALHGAAATSHFRFVLREPAGTHLRFERQADGSYAFFDGSHGDERFTVEAPFAVDAQATARAKFGGHLRRGARRHASLHVRRDGDNLTLELHVDERWLHSSRTHFPVTVDPTITFPSSSQDANFQFCSGCANRPGTDTGYEWVGTDPQVAWRAAFQFNLGQLPPGAQISSASLRLWARKDYCVATSSEPCGARSHTVALDKITAPWSVASTTSQIQTAATTVPAATLAAGDGDKWMAWDVTSLAQAWASGTANYGVLMRRSTEPSDTGGPEFTGANFGDASVTPHLDITYSAVSLAQPDTLHSNGAELSWTPYDGAGFASYEVHRSPTPHFTPSAATRIATINDVGRTTYVDTTAAPNHSFTYKIVTNGSLASNEQRVNLPSDGHATKLLQPDSSSGEQTFISDTAGSTDCTAPDALSDHGADPTSFVGSDQIKERTLLRFDLRDIPAGADVSSATLSAYMTQPPSVPMSVAVHRATAAWIEGTGLATCTGDGANWTEPTPGPDWQASGGDFVASAADSKTHGTSDQPGWDSFDVTSAVQAWTANSAPNEGLVLKAASEVNAAHKYLAYATDDYPDAALRPKLQISYTDGSHAIAPLARVSNLVDGQQQSGVVTVQAGASDDRRVDSASLVVDGNVVGSPDTTAPYSFVWNTSGRASHTVAIRAVDDAGNTATSPATSVQLANSAAPTTSICSPSDVYLEQVRCGDKPNAYWRDHEFGLTETDFSGHGNYAMYGGTSGSYTWQVPGLITGDADTAAKFSQNALGDGKLQETQGSGADGIPGLRLTAEAWINTAGPSLAGTSTRIVSRGWSSDTVAALNTIGGWALSVSKPSQTSSALSLDFRVTGQNTVGTAQILSASAPLTAGRSYVAATFDGDGHLQVFVNGLRAGEFNQQQASPTGANASAPVVVAGSVQGDIVVDEPAVYAAELDAQAIRNHWEIGNHNPPIVKGDVPVVAKAGDDRGVNRVEFLVDGVRYGNDDTVAPYQTTLHTQGAQPIADGQHTLATRVYDDDGQSTGSDAVKLVVDNTSGTKYQAIIKTGPADGSHTEAQQPLPPTQVTYRPGAPTQDAYHVAVTATNKSSQTWAPSDVVVCPTWAPRQDTLPSVDEPQVTLGTLAPNQSVTVTAGVTPPALPAGISREQYDLIFDLCSKTDNQTFRAQGNNPGSAASQATDVKSEPVGLGLEPFYEYDGQEIGAGMEHLVNVASGNSILHWQPFTSPGRGLSTVLNLTYNALEDKTDSTVGNGWSLAISSLSRFGTPLDIHPKSSNNNSNDKYVDLTDGDGTLLHFAGNGNHYEEPAGVHLYLRKLADSGPQSWAVTRPDGVTFYYDDQGWPTSVEDLNGNKVTYTYETINGSEDPGGPKRRITTITDATGQGASPAPNRAYRLTYYAKGEVKGSKIRGMVKEVSDHAGRKLHFEYYEDGNLRRLIQVGGTNPDGSALADRAYVFTYTTSNGNGPAISNEVDRRDPDAKVGNQSTRIYSVRDPRGHETTFSYLGSGNGNDRWKLDSRTDRSGQQTSYAYDAAASRTTVTQPLARVTKYAYDGEGKLTTLTDSLGQDTTIVWTGDREVQKVVEPTVGNLPAAYVEFAYDANGNMTDQWNQLRDHTCLSYGYSQADSSDVSGNWKSGRTVAHLSELRFKKSPKGNCADANDHAFEWEFQYDTDSQGRLRNLVKVIDPVASDGQRHFTQIQPNADGTAAWIKDQNGNQTTFNSYDASGLPTKVTDGENEVSQFGYDNDGLMIFAQDPRHTGAAVASDRTNKSVFEYDPFRRLVRQSTPKTATGDPGMLIWSSVAYDENDNAIRQHSGRYGQNDNPGGAVTTWDYDAMDRVQLETDPVRERMKTSATERVTDAPSTDYDYDAAGRLTSIVAPNGMATATDGDFTTTYDYDKLDRIIKQTRPDYQGATLADTQRTFYCYDDPAGDLKWIVEPKANQTSVDCTGTTPSYDFTTRFGYDKAHRMLSMTDPELHTSVRHYDADGNVDISTDPAGTPTLYGYDQRDLRTQVTERLSAARNVVTRMEYDGVGNLSRLISPRAYDASPDHQTFSDFVASYIYDKANRLVRTNLPKTGSEPQTYLYRGYDAAGNLSAVSVPVTIAPPASVDSTLSFVPATDKTTNTYFDPGWIATENQPDTPTVRFDYTAEGWQRLRAVKLPTGGDRPGRTMTWDYFPDGLLMTLHDRNGDPTSYSYDADGNQRFVDDVAGATTADQQAMDVEIGYDGLNRELQVRSQQRNDSRWLVTKYSGYDLNDNLTDLVDNRLEDSSGSVVSGQTGRRHHYTYGPAGWLSAQVDYGADDAAPGDDRQIATHYLATGWPDARRISARDGAGAFGDSGLASGGVTKQRIARVWSDNGLLNSMETRNGAGAIQASHSISYVDGSNRYVDGLRTSDAFLVNGPNPTAPCKTTTCTRAFTYDGRDRLTDDVRTGGGGQTRSTHYTLNPAGSVADETDPDGKTIHSDYVGQRLTVQTFGGTTSGTLRYRYDTDGNLRCIFTGSTGRQVCPALDHPSPGGRPTTTYDFDALNRMTRAVYQPDSGDQQSGAYSYDALDRLVTEAQAHYDGQTETGTSHTTKYGYLGAGRLIDSQASTYASYPKPGSPHEVLDPTRKKVFSYDNAGAPVSMTDAPKDQPEKQFYLAPDPQGSIELMTTDAGAAQAQYGYNAYGAKDDDLTQEVDPWLQALGETNTKAPDDDPLNDRRYTGKRYDAGSRQIDMGARTFSPEFEGFLQQDNYDGALDNLSLATDSLTDNRYALAGGNPVNFVETDGHDPWGADAAARGCSTICSRTGNPAQVRSVMHRVLSSQSQAVTRPTAARQTMSGVSLTRVGEAAHRAPDKTEFHHPPDVGPNDYVPPCTGQFRNSMDQSVYVTAAQERTPWRCAPSARDRANAAGGAINLLGMGASDGAGELLGGGVRAAFRLGGKSTTGARDAVVTATHEGERFVRVGARPENLSMTFEHAGGTRAGTYAFPEETFNAIGNNPALLKDLGDLPGGLPNYSRILEPPAGTPIQRGIVPGNEFGGRGGVPEVYFPEGF